MSTVLMAPVMMIWMGLMLGSIAPAEHREQPVEASRQAFAAVFEQLEPGGDLLLVLNTENFVQGLSKGLGALIEAVTEGEAGEPAVIARRVGRALPGFLRDKGFLAMQAVGASSVPEGRGIFRSRQFVLRDERASQSPLWQGLIGGAPRALVSHNHWNDDIVWAASGTGDAQRLWEIVMAVVTELIPEAEPAFREALAEWRAETGLDLETAVRSLGDECFVALSLDRTVTFDVPELDIPMPVPALLVGVRLRTPLLFDHLKGLLGEADAPVPVLRSMHHGAEVLSLNLPDPSPFPVQPSFTYREADGLLLFGTSAEVVRRAVDAAQGAGRRLLDTPEFREELGGELPANNGLSYTSRRFSSTLSALLNAAFDMAAADSDELSRMAPLLRSLFAPNSFNVTVAINGRTGVLWQSRGTNRPLQGLQAGLGVPTAGMLAAIAVPNFVRAREAAQRNACVNNLRMLDAAKQQWALEGNQPDEATPTADDLRVYMRTMPTGCPTAPHATYRINAVGANPECSSGRADHRLPR